MILEAGEIFAVIEAVSEVEVKEDQLPSWNRRGGRRPGW